LPLAERIERSGGLGLDAFPASLQAEVTRYGCKAPAVRGWQFADSTARAEVLLKVSTTAGIGVGSTQTRPRRGCDFSSIFSTSGENRLKRDAEKPQRNLFLGVLPPIVSNTILAANRGTGS